MYIHTYIHTYIYVYIYVCTYIHTYIVHTYTYIHITYILISLSPFMVGALLVILSTFLYGKPPPKPKPTETPGGDSTEKPTVVVKNS